MLKPIYKFPYSHKALDFKNVMIVPKKGGNLQSEDISLKKELIFKTTEKNIYWEGIPLIFNNSNLKTFNVIKSHGYISCFSKYVNKRWNETLDLPLEDLKNTNHYILSTSVNQIECNQAILLLNHLRYENIKVKFLYINAQNGYTNLLRDTCEMFRNLYPDLVIIAGNVVTPDCIYDLIKIHGANIVSIGNEGYLDHGVGYPHLSAVIDCSVAAHEAGGFTISNNKTKVNRDIVKAFAGGADFVKCENLFNENLNINKSLIAGCELTNARNLEEFYLNSEFVKI